MSRAHLEFVHDRYNFILESFICDLSPSQINLVANQDNRNLHIYMNFENGCEARVAHIDTELTEMWKPIRRYSVEGVGVVYRVHDAYNMSFTDFGFEVCMVLRSSFGI